jgi:hypothetical protein
MISAFFIVVTAVNHYCWAGTLVVEEVFDNVQNSQYDKRLSGMCISSGKQALAGHNANNGNLNWA